jgi:hypothetical protein
MTDYTADIRGFSILSETWYGKHNLTSEEMQEEISLSLYSPEGDELGQFAIRWLKVGDGYAPRLDAFHDAWSALWRFADLLERLADLGDEGPAPSRVIALLKQLGVTDRTDRRPRNSNEVPVCRCCKQPLRQLTQDAP